MSPSPVSFHYRNIGNSRIISQKVGKIICNLKLEFLFFEIGIFCDNHDWNKLGVVLRIELLLEVIMIFSVDEVAQRNVNILGHIGTIFQ